jgi:phosphoribosylanthranilate isomerase
MSPPAVKFCGLTHAEDARRAVELGAGYLGVIFAGGPRLVTPEQAAEVFKDVGDAGPKRVGVFGEQGAVRVGEMAAAAGLDVAQLHGDPDVAMVEAVRRRFPGNVWAVLRVEGTRLPVAKMTALLGAADAVVLDAKVLGRLGGTGVALEWNALRAAVDDARGAVRGAGCVVLAGGLTPENVGQAVRDLAPDVVDVSSGVERAPGVKDHDRMRAFAEAARAGNL